MVFDDLERYLTENRLIFSDQYLLHSKHCDDCLYRKSDKVFLSSQWRGENQPSLFQESQSYNGKTLILGHSDRFVSKVPLLALRMFGFSKVVGINVDHISDFSFPLPLGLTNPTNESIYHSIFGNADHLVRANTAEFLVDFQPTFFANFSIATNAKLRSHVAKVCNTLSIKVQEPDFSEFGRINYLRSLRMNSFVICPIGNGLDTHRVWETLYMGGIPIIQSHPMLNYLLRDFPVLIIENWSQLKDTSELERRFYQLKSLNWDVGKLDVNYWISSFCKTHK